MTTRDYHDLTPLERELLANAVEGTYLIEIADDRGEAPSVEEYRKHAAAALDGLVDAGLVQVSQGPWETRETKPVGLDVVRGRLADGSAWDADRHELLVIDATAEGRRVMGV